MPDALAGAGSQWLVQTLFESVLFPGYGVLFDWSPGCILRKKPKTAGMIAAFSPVGEAGLGLTADPRLVQVFGDPVPSSELKTWAGMTEARRAKALQRLAALDRYCAEGSEVDAATAAADAGLKLRRFYQLAQLWGDKRSLSSVGAFGSATKSRQGLKPEVANALQAAVNKVVVSNPGASLTSLAKMLWLETNLSTKPPALNTLRKFVEREQRRVREAEQAGTEILFDLTASSLTRSDGLPHVIFLVIDRGTGLALGHAEGVAEDSVAGYREAASDALRRISQTLLRKAIWSSSLERSQIVPGNDTSALAAKLAGLRAELGGATPQMTADAASGRYIRRHMGLDIGTVRLIPAQTAAPLKSVADTVAAGVLSVSEARARVELGVDEYNATLLATFDLGGSVDPPDRLFRLLELLASA